METQQEETLNPLIEDYDSPKLLDLYFSPRNFFSKTIIEGKNLYIKLVTFIVGVATTMDQVDQEMLKMESGRSSVIASIAETWLGYWAFCLGLGLISSFIIWYFGGWWYRKRLEFSGAASPDPFKARYIYVYSSFIHAAPAILVSLIYTALYSNYVEAYTKDLYLGLIVLIFVFISLITSYIGAQTVFVLSKWKARIWFIILPAIFYLILMGALGFLLAKSNIDQYRSSEIVPSNRVITSYDFLFTVKLPEHWSILKDLNEEASIQIGSLEDDMYCIVFSDDKTMLEPGVTLKEFYEIVIGSTRNTMQKLKITELPQLNSFKLNHLRAKIDGEIEYNEITYIIQIVETEKYFFQIISYTLQDNADKLLPVFDKLALSFKEL